MRHSIISAKILCHCDAPAPLGLRRGSKPCPADPGHTWAAGQRRILAGLQLETELFLPYRAQRYSLNIFQIKKLEQTKIPERVRDCRTRVPAERGPLLRLSLSRGSAPAGARHGQETAFPWQLPPGPFPPGHRCRSRRVPGTRGAGRRCQADSPPLRCAPLLPAPRGGGTARGRAPAPRSRPPPARHGPQ